MGKEWTVGEVAALANVTVRTLHHYHAIGLLTPSGRTASGYRLYAPGDLERLHQVLLYRELGLSLEAISGLMDGPAPDRRAALSAQRELLGERAERAEAMIRAVDRALEAMDRGERLEVEDMFEGFESLDAPEEVRAEQARHGGEVRERWGETSSYRESMRRARGYTRADWELLKSESSAIEADMARLMAAGEPPGGEAAMAAAERARLHIDRWFYPCAPGMHAELAAMYETDARFAAHYEERAKGLSAYVAAAVRANAGRSRSEL